MGKYFRFLILCNCEQRACEITTPRKLAVADVDANADTHVITEEIVVPSHLDVVSRTRILLIERRQVPTLHIRHSIAALRLLNLVVGICKVYFCEPQNDRFVGIDILGILYSRSNGVRLHLFHRTPLRLLAYIAAFITIGDIRLATSSAPNIFNFIVLCYLL